MKRVLFDVESDESHKKTDTDDPEQMITVNWS